MRIRDLGPRPAYQLVLAGAVLLLALKVVAAIVWEYRNYFPPNFESAFLIGRDGYFFGFYQIAFYIHIAAGPPAIMLCLFMLATGAFRRQLRSRFWLHRRAGQLLWPLVIFLLAPSGLVMAPFAMAGLPSAIAFACLSAATLATAILTVFHARAQNIAAHRRWAGRCAVLLLSPLLLRLVGGTLDTLQWEAPIGYQLNAWLSWLIPFFTFEFFQMQRSAQLTRLSHSEIKPDANDLGADYA